MLRYRSTVAVANPDKPKSKTIHQMIITVTQMAAEFSVFVLFALITLGASLGVVFVKDVFYDALFLGVALVSVAAHFVMLNAEFIGAMQILVYVGGVLILIVFAIMFMRSTVEGEDDSSSEEVPR